MIAVYSPDQSQDNLFLSNYATINLLDNIKRLNGVGDAFLFGGLDYSMRVWLQTDRLTSLGLTPNDVIAAIQGQNIQAAVGRVGAQPMTDYQLFQLNIQTKGRLVPTEEFEQIVVRANPDGSFVRIRDVGRVELGAKTSDAQGRFNGGPRALMAIFLAPGATAGIDHVTVEMRANNFAARSFYEALGFTHVPYIAGYYQNVEPAIRMRRDLHQRATLREPGKAI